MIIGEATGHPATSPYLRGRLAGTIDTKPKGYKLLGKPPAAYKYARFCDFVGWFLDSPAFETGSVYPIMQDETRVVDISTTYEVVNIAQKNNVLPFASKLNDKEFDAFWFLVKEKGAKNTLGWVLAALTMRMDNNSKRAEKLEGLDYSGVGATFVMVGNDYAKLKAKPDDEILGMCALTENKMLVMDAYLKGKPDPLTAPPKQGTQPQQQLAIEPQAQGEPKQGEPSTDGLGILPLAIGGIALYYLLSKGGSR